MPDTHTQTYEDILYRVEDGVAVVTLNRPEKLNAWRAEMDRDVRAAMRAASDDPEVRVIVLTGAGKGFCAGADMGLLQSIQKSSTAASSSTAGGGGGGGGASAPTTEGLAEGRMPAT